MRVLFLLCLLGACKTPPHPAVTGKIERFELRSQSVNDTYVILVRTPPGYDANETYPVVVQLDATFSFLEQHAVTAGHASDLEAAGVIPRTLVVGIGGGDRFRDDAISTGAPAFYGFIKDELMPWLKERYKMREKFLFGHSFGGLFALYALFQHDAKAPLFDGFTAASPSILYENANVLDGLEPFLAQPNPPELYLAVGGLEGPEMNVYVADLADKLAKAGRPPVAADRFPQDHIGTISPAYRIGLSLLLGGR